MMLVDLSSGAARQRVTALELFFGLVFVFAITQVASFLYRNPGWLPLLEAFAILMGPLVRLDGLRLVWDHGGD